MSQFPKFNRKKALTIAAACMMSFIPTFAQDEEEDLDLGALFDLKIETGSFLELERSKSPVTMTIIDGKMLKNSAARNLSEALEIYVPGFQVMENKWNGPVWGMRGVAADRNNKIIVMVNGYKQNLQNYHGFATEYDLGLLGDIQRIEVLRGPAGLVYGSGAIAGVVNIVTKAAEEDSKYASAKIDVNGANSVHGVTLEGGLNHTFGNGQNLIISAGYKKSNGLGENVARAYGHLEWPEQTLPDSGLATAGSPGYTPGNTLLSIDYNVNKYMNYYSRFTRQYTTVAPYFIENYGVGWRGDRRFHMRDNVLLGGQFGVDIGKDRLTFDASATFANNQNFNRNARAEVELTDAAGNTEKKVINLAQEPGWQTGERRFEGTLKYLLKRVDNLQAAAGVQYRFDKIGKNMAEYNNSGIEAEYDNLAGFGEAYWTINDLFGLEGGVRYDAHTKTDGVLSPKGAVVVTPSKDHVIKFIAQSSSNNAGADGYETTGPNSWTYELAGDYKLATDSVFVKDTVGGKVVVTDDYREALIVDATGEEMTLFGNTQAPVQGLVPEKSVSFELASSHNFGTFNVSPSFSFNRMSELHMWSNVMKQTVNVGTYDAFVIELDLAKKWDKVSIGGNGAFMKPLNTKTSEDVFTRSKFRPVYDNGWRPAEIPGTVELKETISKNQISYDGEYFNSLHTITSKLFADWDPSEYVTIHSDMRLFFGLWGREKLEKEYIAKAKGNYDFLGMTDKTPMAKWNMAVHFHLPKSLDVSVLGYDLLGNDHNEHAVRWSQMAAPSQDDYFTVDQRSFGLKLTKGF